MHLDSRNFRELRLVKKLLGGFSRFSQRLRQGTWLSGELWRSHSRSEVAEPASRSRDRLEFMRYIEEAANQTTEWDQQQWEVLSQIHHTPRPPLLASRRRYRSLTDLRSRSKVSAKVNELLDFVMTQMLGYRGSGDGASLDSAIGALVLEACVELVLAHANVVRASPASAPTSTDYLRIVCSPGSGISDNTLSEPLEPRTSNNALSHNSSLICLANKSHRPQTGIKPRLNSPSASNERSTFRYAANKHHKLEKNPKRSIARNTNAAAARNRNIRNPVVNNSSSSFKRNNGEYIYYVSAKRAVINTVKPKQNGVSIDDQLKTRNGSQAKVSLKKEAHREISPKSSRTPEKKLTSPKLQNAFSYKAVQFKENNTKTEILQSVVNTKRGKRENLQIIQAASVNCLNIREADASNSNVKVLSINYDKSENISLDPTNPKFKITPITFIFAGEGDNPKLPKSKSFSALNKMKSVVSNIKCFESEPSCLVRSDLPQNMKSTTAFGRNSSSVNLTKTPSKLQTSNYCVVKPHGEIGDLSLTISLTEAANRLLRRPAFSKTPLRSESPSVDLINVSTNEMTNNNNDVDKLEPDFSETDGATTTEDDSGFMNFQSVKAKFRSGETIEDADSNRVRLDPDPNEIRDIYEKVMNTTAFNRGQSAAGKTFSCNEENNICQFNQTSALNSHSFNSKYSSSVNEEDVEPGNLDVQEDCIIELQKLSPAIESEDLHRSTRESEFPSNKRDVISTSVIDICPSSFNTNFDDEIVSEPMGCVTNVFCRKNNKNCIQKNRSETLFRHTFASQQKVRIKHE